MGEGPHTPDAGVAAIIGPQRVPFAWQVEGALPAGTDDPKELLLCVTLTSWTGAHVIYMDPDQAERLAQGIWRASTEVRRRRRRGLVVPGNTAEVLQLTRKGDDHGNPQTQG